MPAEIEALLDPRRIAEEARPGELGQPLRRRRPDRGVGRRQPARPRRAGEALPGGEDLHRGEPAGDEPDQPDQRADRRDRRDGGERPRQWAKGTRRARRLAQPRSTPGAERRSGGGQREAAEEEDRDGDRRRLAVERLEPERQTGGERRAQAPGASAGGGGGSEIGS